MGAGKQQLLFYREAGGLHLPSLLPAQLLAVHSVLIILFLNGSGLVCSAGGGSHAWMRCVSLRKAHGRDQHWMLGWRSPRHRRQQSVG